jgi:hypothetical protein
MRHLISLLIYAVLISLLVEPPAMRCPGIFFLLCVSADSIVLSLPLIAIDSCLFLLYSLPTHSFIGDRLDNDPGLLITPPAPELPAESFTQV